MQRLSLPARWQAAKMAGWPALRRGSATLDYILVLGIVLPLLAIVIPQGRRMMQLVFEMTCALVSWPFM